MNQRSQIYLYSTLAVGFAVVACLSLRRSTSITEELADLRRRIDDLANYIQPLRDYSKNRVQPL